MSDRNVESELRAKVAQLNEQVHILKDERVRVRDVLQQITAGMVAVSGYSKLLLKPGGCEPQLQKELAKSIEKQAGDAVALLKSIQESASD